MSNLPPLPLIGGALFIDNSSWVEAMSTCSRYLQYRCLNLRVNAGEKPSLNFGSALHLALEHRYRIYGPRPVDDTYYETVSEIFTQFFTLHEPPLEDWRNSNWAMETIRRYNDRYEREEFQLLTDPKGNFIVELPFAVELYRHTTHRVGMPNEIPVIYSGRIDLPVSLEGGIWVLDWKTTGSLGDQFWNEYRISAQPRGYAWAWWQKTGQRPVGYIISAIRSKQPPQYVQNNTVWKGKSQSPADWWRESLVRERYYLKPGELDDWRNNTIEIVEEFFWHYHRGYLPMKTKWCASYGKCPYLDVCVMDHDDRENFLMNTGLYVNNTWSPLRDPTMSKQ